MCPARRDTHASQDINTRQSTLICPMERQSASNWATCELDGQGRIRTGKTCGASTRSMGRHEDGINPSASALYWLPMFLLISSCLCVPDQGTMKKLQGSSLTKHGQASRPNVVRFSNLAVVTQRVENFQSSLCVSARTVGVKLSSGCHGEGDWRVWNSKYEPV